jgi:predicted DNA-binding transcriptional regulator YafY
MKAIVDEVLRTAIEHRRLIRLIYQDKERIIEPHDYGIQNGSAKLLAYQVAGESSGKLPDWRWLQVDQISDIQMLDQAFSGGRTIPSQKHHAWDHLFIRVKSGDDI